MTAEEAAERVCAVLREITAGGLEVATGWGEDALVFFDDRGPEMLRVTVFGVGEDGRVVDFRHDAGP